MSDSRLTPLDVCRKQQQKQPMSEEHAAELNALGLRVVHEAQEYKSEEKKWAISHSSLYHLVHPAVAPWIEVTRSCFSVPFSPARYRMLVTWLRFDFIFTQLFADRMMTCCRPSPLVFPLQQYLDRKRMLVAANYGVCRPLHLRLSAVRV